MAGRQNEHRADEAARRADETAREATRKAADEAARTAREMSEAAQRASRQGMEAAQQNSDQLSSSWRSSTDAAHQIAEHSLERWSRMFGLTGETATQALQQSSGNMHAMFETTTVIADGLRDLSGEWMQFVQAQAQRNFEHFDRLMGCRNLQDLMASQTQIAREHFEAFLESTKRTSERSTKLADEAVRKMSETPLAPR
jgi:phasin family protein